MELRKTFLDYIQGAVYKVQSSEFDKIFVQ